MRHLETKKFLNGLIIGALTMTAFVGIMTVLVLYKKSGIEQAWEIKNRPVDSGEEKNTPDTTTEQWESVSDYSTESPIEEEDEPISESDLAGVETASIDGKEYMVWQTLPHPHDDVIFRFLVPLNNASFERIEFALNYGSDNDFAGFNGDTYWNSSSPDITPLFTFWSEKSEQPFFKTTEISDLVADGPLSAKVVKWIDDKIVIQSGYSDAGTSIRLFFTYNYKNQTLNAGVVMISSTDFGVGNNQGYATSTKSWRVGNKALVQTKQNDLFSDIYLESFAEEGSPDEGDYKLDNPIYISSKELKIDITSDYNLRNYEQGLKGEINGKEVILQWK